MSNLNVEPKYLSNLNNPKITNKQLKRIKYKMKLNLKNPYIKIKILITIQKYHLKG